MEKQECLRIRTFQNIPTPEEFASQIELRNVPAVFVGCVKNWKAFTLWNPSNGGLDYLQGRVGSSVVDAMLSKSAPVFYGDIRRHDRVPLPFSTFIGFCKELHGDIDSNSGACCKSEKDMPSDESSQICIASEDDNKQVYLAQVSIMNTEHEERVQLPTLREDIKLPEFLEAKSLASINLWMNSARARSSTHYDPHHNVLCVVSGCKQGVTHIFQGLDIQVIVSYNVGYNLGLSLAPFAYGLLQQVLAYIQCHCTGRLQTTGKADLSVHPRAETSEKISQKVTIHAGDALFIPEGWFHQVDSDCLTMAVNFWWRSEVMLAMSEHMDSYYMRRILKSTEHCEIMTVALMIRTEPSALYSTKPYNDVPILNKDSSSKGSKAKKLKEKTMLHELEPLAVQSLHALVSLVHDLVNTADQSQSADPSTSDVFAVGEKGGSKLSVKDACRLEDDPVASIIWKLQPLTLQSVLIAMAQNFPRTLETLVLHLLSPVGAEVLTRRLEEMDQLMDEEDRNDFYQIFYGVFDDQFAVMDALLNQKESFALQAFRNVLDKYLGIKFNGSTPWVG
uniref:JmjC domain-containing protein n=1 Tax=Daucus carota subsp. sativus TaxID=79200 RepID=A0A166HBJ9_DAUCS